MERGRGHNRFTIILQMLVFFILLNSCDNKNPVFTNPSITLIYPDGGESFAKGQEITITWESNNLSGNIGIELYKTGISVLKITDSIPDSGQFRLKLSYDLTDGDDYKIKLTAFNDNLSDFSNSYFSIKSNYLLEIIYPNGGEILNKNKNYLIKWKALNIDGDLQIDLYKDQYYVQKLAESISNASSFYFHVDNELQYGNDYKIMISALNKTIYDLSDDYFTIQSEDTELVGTWVLTKVIVPAYNDAELTPEALGQSVTFEIKSDRSFSATVTDSSGTDVQTGTWSVNNGVVTMTGSDNTVVTMQYSVSGNKLTVETMYNIDPFGEVNVKLELTKQ